MVSELLIRSIMRSFNEVLILVLVEDGIGESENPQTYYTVRVLILVLVEDGIGELCIFSQGWG